MASATAPPTPVSISSNTRVGAEPRSASTTFSASRKRASSPPEATFISGPGRVPGLVCTQNSTRSMPCGPAAAASLSIWVENFARSSLSGLSSPLTALSSAAAAFARACESVCGRSAITALGLRSGGLQRLELFLAGIDQCDVGIVFARQRREFIDRNVVFAARRAEREQPLLDALQFGRIEIGGAQAPLRDGRGFPPTRRARRRAPSPPARPAPAPARCAVPAGGSRPTAPAPGIGAGDHVVGLAQILGDLLRLHHRGAPLGQRGLLAGLRRELAQLLDRVAQPVALALGALDFGTMRIGRGLRLRAAPPTALRLLPASSSSPPKASSSRR